MIADSPLTRKGVYTSENRGGYSRKTRKKGVERTDKKRRAEATNPHEIRLGAGDGTRTRDSLLGRQYSVSSPQNRCSRLVLDRVGSGFSHVRGVRGRQAR